MDDTLFITGGLGYLGSALARRALKQGYFVVLFDNLFYKQDKGRIIDEIIADDEAMRERCMVVMGDTRNKEEIEKAVEKYNPDWIVHFGELVGVYACEHNPKLTEEINWDGTKNVVDVAYERNIPFLYNSSSSVYGTQKDNTPLSEEAPLPNPRDLYCIYKLKVEQYIQQLKMNHTDWRVIVFRPATVCGPAPRMRIELLPNHFTYSALKKGRILLAGAHTGRAVIDIRDMINAYMKVLDAHTWSHLIYNIGHYSWTKQEYAQAIVDVVGGDIIANENVGDMRNLGIDNTRIEQEFDWKPEFSFEQTVVDIKEWIESHEEELEKSNFANIINMPLEVWKTII